MVEGRRKGKICGDDPVKIQKCEIVYTVYERGPWNDTLNGGTWENFTPTPQHPPGGGGGFPVAVSVEQGRESMTDERSLSDVQPCLRYQRLTLRAYTLTQKRRVWQSSKTIEKVTDKMFNAQSLIRDGSSLLSCSTSIRRRHVEIMSEQTSTHQRLLAWAPPVWRLRALSSWRSR